MTRIEDEAVNAIRNTGADHLRVTIRGESEPRRVAISSRRNRWQQLQAVLSTMEWTRIDCCDKAGGVLHTVVDEDAANAAAPAKTTPTIDAAAGLAERFAGLLVQQHQAIVRAQSEQYVATLRGYEQLVDRLTTSIGDLRGIFTEALTMQRSAFMAAASSGGDGTPGSTDNDMLKMLMMGWMQQRMGAAAAPSSPPPPPKTPPPPPKNGETKT